jgi:NAD(P)-dependent dehydrogenase (short-subunit alcohol dehydrogenase family)
VTKGIGRASAIAFANEHCKVAAVDIDEEGGNETTKIIKSNGGEATFFKADVSKSEGNLTKPSF